MTDTQKREVAVRTFAHELNDATHTFEEEDDDTAPVYALLPTGAKANRVIIGGTLTEVEDVGDDSEYWQGRIVDPAGDSAYVYAGQYQPDCAKFLSRADTPQYVLVVGKPRTFETDDGEVNVSLRPEHITVVDEETRDKWATETAEHTLDRIQSFTDPADTYTKLAQDEYGGDLDKYRDGTVAILEALD
jgi:RPA family protein